MFSRLKRKVLAIYLGFIIASLRNILAIIRAALVAIISSKHYDENDPSIRGLVIKTVSYVIILELQRASDRSEVWSTRSETGLGPTQNLAHGPRVLIGSTQPRPDFG